MTRKQCFLMSVPVAALAIGPMITFFSFLVRWPLGLTSSQAFTRYPHLIAAMGAITGLLAAVACGLMRCRPWASGLLSGAIVFSLMATVSVVMLLRGSFTRVDPGLAVEVLICAATAAVTAYLTALAVLEWGRRQPTSTVQPREPGPSSTGYRYRL